MLSLASEGRPEAVKVFVDFLSSCVNLDVASNGGGRFLLLLGVWLECRPPLTSSFTAAWLHRVVDRRDDRDGETSLAAVCGFAPGEEQNAIVGRRSFHALGGITFRTCLPVLRSRFPFLGKKRWAAVRGGCWRACLSAHATPFPLN